MRVAPLMSLIRSFVFCLLTGLLAFTWNCAHAADGATNAEAPPPPPVVGQPSINLGEDGDYLLTTKYPFVPQQTDYSIEIGAMSEKHSLYWVAGNVGEHVGRCLFTSTQSCQQYLDLLIGIAGRDAETYGAFLGSVRWQFVNFPRSWSPLFRLYGGALRARVEQGKSWRPTYGAGIGVVMYLHHNVDLRLETRLGYADRPIGQAIFAIQVKSDRLLEYFARRLAELGLSTVETAIQATGAAVKATGEGIAAGLQTVTSPFRKDEKKPGSEGEKVHQETESEQKPENNTEKQPKK